MNILDLLGFQTRDLTGKAKKSPLPIWKEADLQNAAWGELVDPSVYAAQAVYYSRSDLVYMCVDRRAAMCAQAAHKLHLYDPLSKRDPNTNLPEKEIETHPFLDLWRNPNPFDSQTEFMEATSISLDLNGNAYWQWVDGNKPKTRGGKYFIELESDPLSVFTMRPDRLIPEAGKDELLLQYRYVSGTGIKETLIAPHAITHTKRFHPLLDLNGLSPLEAAFKAVSADVSAQEANQALFKNGMRLSGVIETPTAHVDEDEVKLMEKYILETYTGNPDKWFQVMFLWNDFKYKEMGMSMKDAEFIEGSKMSRMRIFGVYAVHPAVVLADDVNLANAKIGEYVTLKYGISPQLARIAGEITKSLSGDNRLFKDAPEVEAHFVGVVPQDQELEARVTETNARSVDTLIRALGKEEGIAEAKRKGLISEEVKFVSAPLPPAPVFPVNENGTEEEAQQLAAKADPLKRMKPASQEAVKDIAQEVAALRKKQLEKARARLLKISDAEWERAVENDKNGE